MPSSGPSNAPVNSGKPRKHLTLARSKKCNSCKEKGLICNGKFPCGGCNDPEDCNYDVPGRCDFCKKGNRKCDRKGPCGACMKRKDRGWTCSLGGGDGERPKRKIKILSCDRCRKLKAKCDKRGPCDRCLNAEKGWECSNTSGGGGGGGRSTDPQDTGTITGGEKVSSSGERSNPEGSVDGGRSIKGKERSLVDSGGSTNSGRDAGGTAESRRREEVKPKRQTLPS